MAAQQVRPQPGQRDLPYGSGGLRIDVEFVENIELVRTGKRLASVSKLPIDFQKSGLKRASGSTGE